MNQGQTELIVLTALFCMFALVPLFQVSFSEDDNIKSLGIYRSGSMPYGLSYGQWAVRWWTWLVGIPSNINPATDATGANCAQGQNGPVWFLAGSTTGKAERSCTIPADKAIFFPIIGSECSYAEYPKLKTESELGNCAKSQNGQVTLIEAKVDGVSLQSSQMPRMQSQLFSVKFPSDNIFGAAAGDSQSVADGYYVFLRPLPVGKHEISFKAVSVQFTTTGTQNISQNLIYHITIR
jgi:hypothetical protein